MRAFFMRAAAIVNAPALAGAHPARYPLLSH
jgi:hypothetical protein